MNIKVLDKNFIVTAKHIDTVDKFPFESDNKYDGYHNVFNVTVKFENKRQSFKFYDSTANYENGITELNNDSLKNALSSFLSDAQAATMSFEEFCNGFGYNTDSRKAVKIYKECQKTLNKVTSMGINESELCDLLNKLDK